MQKKSENRQPAKMTATEKAAKMALQAGEVFRCVDREIWIITAGSEGSGGGCVATWVSQASIAPDRPTVVAGIAVNHFTAELIDRHQSFAAHLITPNQIDLAWRFALESGRETDKLQGLALQAAETGSPILTESLGWLDCRVFYRLDAGDRAFYWADVVAAARPQDAAPLREHELIASATPEQLRALGAKMQADLAFQRPLAEQWRTQIGNF